MVTKTAKEGAGKDESARISFIEEAKRLDDNRLYDTAFVSEYGRIEGIRAERYGKPFSVIMIEVESFYKGEKDASKKEMQDFFKILVTTTLDVVRNCDVTGVLDDKRLIVILPQTDAFGAMIAIKKLGKALEPVTVKGEPYANVIVSHASFPREASGYGELVAAASRKLEGIKTSLWEKLDFKNKLFWEIMNALTSGTLNGDDHASFEVGPGNDLDNTFIQKVNDMILQEIGRAPDRRGILYLGVKSTAKESYVKKALASLDKNSTRIFMLGDGKDEKNEIKNATVVSVRDPRLATTWFSFFLSEDSAYVFAAKENWGDIHTCFHSSDQYFVDSLITKLQRDYSFQEQI